MYCPNFECSDRERTGVPGEYRDGVTSCPYCGTPLVAEVPGDEGSERVDGLEGPPAERTWAPGIEDTVVVRTSDLVMKQLAAAALDEAGIPFMERAVLPGGLSLGHATWAPHPGQEYEIVVSGTAEDAARQVVGEAVGGVIEEGPGLVAPNPFGGRRRGGVATAVVLLVFGAMMALAVARLLRHLL